jgi:hypothetical protein
VQTREGIFKLSKSIGWKYAFAGAIVLGASSWASAQTPVTFAQVESASSNTTSELYAYTNNGLGSDAEFSTDSGGTLGAPIAVDFTFLQGLGILPADLQGPQSATLTLTSSTTKAVTSAGGGIVASQLIDGSGAVKTDVLTITRNTPAAVGDGTGSRTNLLTMTFTGDLIGVVGGATPELFGDTALNDTVIYSSDFLNFSSATEEDFNLALSSWDPLVSPPAGLGIAADGYYNSAGAAGVGTFDFQGAATVIPEPTSTALAAVGGLLLIVGCGRQSRRLNWWRPSSGSI